MPSVIAVIPGEGMPSFEELNAAMQDAGLNVVIHHSVTEEAGPSIWLVSVVGLLTVIEFEGAPMESHRTWFPVGRVAVAGARGVLKFSWREGDKPAEAAAWTVASTVGAMRSGKLFTADKVYPLAASLSRLDARELLAALPVDPSRPPGPPTWEELNDLIEEYFAQAGFEIDVEASAKRLLERTLEYHSALREQGEKS